MGEVILDWLIVNQGHILATVIVIICTAYLIFLLPSSASAELDVGPAYDDTRESMLDPLERELHGIEVRLGDRNIECGQSTYEPVEIITLVRAAQHQVRAHKNLEWRFRLQAAIQEKWIVGMSVTFVLAVAILGAWWVSNRNLVPLTTLLKLPDLYCKPKANADSLIIFVHGWNGDAQETWRKFPQLVCDDHRFSKTDVIAIDYPTYIVKRNLRLAEIAQFINEKGDAIGLFKRYKRYAMITHSMGGIIAREMVILQDLARQPNKPALIVEIGTPHLGAGLAQIASAIGIDRNRAEELVPESSLLVSLRTYWGAMSDYAPKTSCYSSPHDQVVTQASATFQCDTKHAYPVGDHRDIAKPNNYDDVRYAFPINDVLKYLVTS